MREIGEQGADYVCVVEFLIRRTAGVVAFTNHALWQFQRVGMRNLNFLSPCTRGEFAGYGTQHSFGRLR
jgi:hypothetical protein